MNVTIDFKTFLILLVLIALIVLIIYGILLLRKLLVTLEHANRVLEDVEVVSEIAAARSSDLDGIIENVSDAASGLSDAMADKSLVTTAGSVAKAAASLKGMFSDSNSGSAQEERAAKRKERRENRESRSDRRKKN